MEESESVMATKPLRGKIESRHHPLLKAVRRMVRAGELSADGQVLLETVRLIEEALASGVSISQVLVSSNPSPRIQQLLKRLAPQTAIYEVTPKVFEALPSTQTPQGILALARVPHWSEADLCRRQPALLLVLSGLQDPGNLGTILRSAEAFGATGVLLTQGTVSPYNAKAVRASAGALFRIPTLYGLTETETVTLLRRKRARLFASVVEGGKQLSEIDLTGPVAIALGSEGAGLPSELLAAGKPFTIPMAPAVESLNVAIAAAVILYEIARQRAALSKL